MSTSDNHQLEQELIAIVGKDNVLSSPVDLAVYECDGETLDTARPDLVVLPASAEEVAEVIKVANRYKVPVSPRGAGTGLSGGATTIMGGISLALTRMKKIINVDPENLSATVEVGVTNLAVSKAAAKWGLYFAPDPSSQIASTIGGNIAENSGGPHTLKYGMTIQHVLGVKVVLPDGRITTFGGKARDNSGLDLLGIFIGSEGTLGIAVEAVLKLTSLPKQIETMIAYFPSVEQGGQAVSDIVACGVIPAAMEMIDKLTLNAVEDALKLGLKKEAGALLIVELDGQKAGIAAQKEIVVNCVNKNNAMNISWAENAKERMSIWKARKSAFGALGRIAPHAYVLDGVIPRSKLAEAISSIEVIGDKYKVMVANVYHAGDGNLHPAILFHRDNEEETLRVMNAAREILELCLKLGGTLSGEHGIGIEKLDEMDLAFSKIDLKCMSYVHDVFNPEGILNPGKVIPNLKTCGESGIRPLLRHRLSAAGTLN
jgi:glycolate oxidase subunit GlcD